MQITFFVGNGFDLACGIHSSYSQFYEWYCKQEESKLAHINTFRKQIDQDIKAGKKNWADFEEALGQYTQNFTVDTVQQFFDCYNDASEKLMEYLQIELDRFENEIISDEELQKLINGLKGFYLELKPRERQVIEQVFKERITENRVINFVSYNYTDTLDRCISGVGGGAIATWQAPTGHTYKLTVNPNVIHAHGRLMQNPVFGVNDESQIKNADLLSVPDFESVMIKPRCVEELGEFWHDEIDGQINNSTIICIWGMSMGITDKIWFSKIIKWLRIDPNRQLIIFWYTDTPSNNKQNMTFFYNRRQARNKILDYSVYDNKEKEMLANRIHIVENTKSVLKVSLREKKGE